MKSDIAKRIEKAMNEAKRGFKSQSYDKRTIHQGMIKPYQIHYSMNLFRRISEKAWMINTIIGHIIDKVTPYMRPYYGNSNPRGMAVELKDPDKKATAADKKKAAEIMEFLQRTSWPEIDNHYEIAESHEDDLIHYTKKIIRDLLTLDQTASEKLWTRGNKLLAFEAVDAATIVRCIEEGYRGDDSIRFVQMVDSRIVSQYTAKEMLFQYQNPRTDIKHAGYGYSKIEQCLDLVISLINSFQFNAGAFTDDKLPRGMLLLSGDMGIEEVEEIEDYIIDVMSQPGSGKWSVPIVPSGDKDNKLEWKDFGKSNQDMQFSRWQDTLYMSIGAVFGVNIESMGIKSENSAKFSESGSAEARRYSDDKGIGSVLTFLERHFQDYVDAIDDRFRVKFYGFEQDDSEDQRKAVEHELSTWKSLNDVRRENDQEEIDEDWANIPGLQNPQYLQAWQAANAQSEEMGGNMGEEGNYNEENSYDEEEFDDELEKSIDDTIRIIV